MSRLTRALGFGDSGDKGSQSRAASPKVRRIRETMRWRGYDLSDYTDEQIAAASARFPNDISEEGETTEDGRRALAAALEAGDFTPAAPPPAGGQDADGDEAVAAAPPPRKARRTPPADSAASYRAALGMPSLPERLAHVFGVHAWRPIEGEESNRLQCVGCGQLRDAPHPFRPPPTPPPPPPPPPTGESVSRRESPPSPLDDLAGFRDREREREREQEQEESGAIPGMPRPKGQQRSGSIWDFFMGLPWWTKLLAFFIGLQVVLFIVRAVAGSGGG